MKRDLEVVIGVIGYVQPVFGARIVINIRGFGFNSGNITK